MQARLQDSVTGGAEINFGGEGAREVYLSEYILYYVNIYIM